MDIVINGSNLVLKFSNRSKIVKSKTGILNAIVNFANADKVLDEEKGYLYYDNNSLSWVFCGLDQIKPNESIGTLGLVIESPHKSEYSILGIPLRPANGRTGRLLINLELMKAGYPPIDIKFTDRKRYYDAFDAYYVKKDLSAMTKLFAEYLNARLAEYLKILG